MSGPEHYREAERLVNLAQDSEVFQQSATAMAQVHATLSLAAATALGREGADGTMPGRDRAQWFDAAAVPSPKLSEAVQS
jgi:hypothetical protein